MNIRCLRPLIAAALACVAGGAMASPNGLVISQVYGAGGNANSLYANDFIEVFNAGANAISIAGYSVQYGATGGTTWQVTPLPAVTLQAGQYLLVQEAAGGGSQAALPTADATGSINMSGTTGKVALSSSTSALTGAQPASPALIDLVGFGTPNGYETAPAPVLTATTAALRSSAGCMDTDNNSADFTAATPTPRNTITTRNVCGAPVNAPIVASCPAVTLPASTGGTFAPSATDADGIVNGVTILSTLPSSVSVGAFTPATAIGGTASQSFSVASNPPGTVFAFTLEWSNAQGQTVQCSQNVTLVGITPTYLIQGHGATSPYLNLSILTQGVVTKVNSNGFFIQDAVGDNDPTTSDGLFVFTNRASTVSPGQLVTVTGTVTEFNTGAASNSDTSTHTVTELGSVGTIQVIGSGSITPVVVNMPLATRDTMEQYEGMLVTLTGPLTVGQNYFLGEYGQLSMSVLGRLQGPTNVVRPGPGALAMEADNQRRLIILDDGSSLTDPNPTPYIGVGGTNRAGDTVDSLTGVIDFGLTTSSSADPGSYKIHPTIAPVFTRANPRTTAPEDVGGNIKIAAANVLNFFTTFTNGQTVSGQTGQGCSLGGAVAAGNCRGADSLAEYQRQVAKIVDAFSAINADAFGIMELQNNGDVAVQTLVDALNAKIGSPMYAVVPAPSQGTGTDAIRVGMIYKPSKLTLFGASISNTDAINNRPPFAQTFIAPNGDKFIFVVNHLKSKGSCPTSGADNDQGDLQGCWNATRTAQATALRNFVTSLQTSQGTQDVLMVGDFNAYAQEDPIAYLTGTAGYVDQIGRFNTFGYSYVFNSEAGRLDHAIATPTLSTKVTRAIEWHINADEPEFIDYNLEFKQPMCLTCGADLYTDSPYRASDHDPVVIGLQFNGPPPVLPPVRPPIRTPAVLTAK